jgi:hypothetical protein
MMRSGRRGVDGGVRFRRERLHEILGTALAIPLGPVGLVTGSWPMGRSEGHLISHISAPFHEAYERS